MRPVSYNNHQVTGSKSSPRTYTIKKSWMSKCPATPSRRLHFVSSDLNADRQSCQEVLFLELDRVPARAQRPGAQELGPH